MRDGSHTVSIIDSVMLFQSILKDMREVCRRLRICLHPCYTEDILTLAGSDLTWGQSIVLIPLIHVLIRRNSKKNGRPAVSLLRCHRLYALGEESPCVCARVDQQDERRVLH